jgi:hypothetical protein
MESQQANPSNLPTPLEELNELNKTYRQRPMPDQAVFAIICYPTEHFDPKKVRLSNAYRNDKEANDDLLRRVLEVGFLV